MTVSGNNGHAGTFGAAAPEGGGDDMFAVGSVDVAYKYSVYRPARLIVDGVPVKDLEYNPETWTAHRRSEFPTRVAVAAISNDAAAEADGCESIDGTRFPDNTLALVRRGGCTFKIKMENLVKAGIKFALIYNNVPGPAFDLEVRLDDGLRIQGAASLTQETGEELLSLLAKNRAVELEMDSDFTRPPILRPSSNTRTAAKVSTFTTWGPSGEGKFLSSVLSPGGGVLSTFPRRNGGWGIQSGSSMAVPYMVGVLALLKERFPTVPTKNIADALSLTARPVSFNDGTNKTYDFLSSPWQQGSGLVDAWGAFKALEAGMKTDSTRLSFNDTEFGAKEIQLTIQNTGRERVVYELSVVPGVTLLALDTITNTPISFAAAVRAPEASSAFLETLMPHTQANISLSQAELVLDPGQEAVLKVFVDTIKMELTQDRCPLYGGWIKFTSSNSQHLSIPFGGAACKIKDIPTLNQNLSYLSISTREGVETARFWNRPLIPVEEGRVFELSREQPPFDMSHPDKERFAKESLPVVQIQLSMDTRSIRAELVPMSGDLPVEVYGHEVGTRIGGWGRVETIHWVWDGRLPNGSFAEAGDYSFRIRALRLFGNESVESDWKDEVASVGFKLAYENSPAPSVEEEGASNQKSLVSDVQVPCF